MSGCGAFPQQHAALWQRLPDYFWPPMGWWRANGSGRPSWAAGIANGPGIEGSREPAPQMAETEGGWAVLIHKPKAAAGKVPGVRRRDALLSLWSGGPMP